MSILQNNTLIFTKQFPVQVGTVGGFFSLPGSTDIYGITNFHVVQHDGTAKLEDAIFEGGNRAQIGSLRYWYNLNGDGGINYFDLALFKINQAVVKPLWNIAITGYVEASAADFVELHKGNGGIRFGKSLGLLPGPFSIPIAGHVFRFCNLIKIVCTQAFGSFSEAGDSGSVIISENKIVGLLVGTDPNDAAISYAIPFLDSISQKGILNYLELTPI